MKNQVKQLGYVCLVSLVLSACGTSSGPVPTIAQDAENQATSVSVATQALPGGAKACFYEHINYGGNSFCSDSGSSLLSMQWNDRISSVRLAQGVQVQLFADRDYQGKTLKLRTNTPTLVKFRLNDLASSYKVSAGATTPPVVPPPVNPPPPVTPPPVIPPPVIPPPPPVTPPPVTPPPVTPPPVTPPPVTPPPVTPPPVTPPPVTPPPVTPPPVTPPPVTPPTSDFDKKCTPTVTLQIEDQARKNLFLDVAGSDPEAFMQEIGRKVCATLYQKASEIRDASHITFILRDDPNTVAYKSGNGSDIEVMISTAHLTIIKNSGRDMDKEIRGVLFHEMTHMYQQDDSDMGGADGGLIEGIADAVRFRNGYMPDGSQPDKNGHWNDGYGTTAFFLLWVDQQYGNLIYKLNLSMDNQDGIKWTPAAFQSITGKTVDQLWSDYIQSK